MEYQEHDQNSFCFSGLASSFKALKGSVAVNLIARRISSSLTHDVHKYYDGINFSNEIILDKARNKGDKNPRYQQVKWKKTGTFDILINISNHITLT